ncbi:hypothetical protein SAY86_001905 [Trapa natans]|uniref:Uncharacterized protein n=1 Tax=Trapa natans TaxID=22666 RepID=A0AAN7LF40_TRANT|nr:hypothetical protein SAY86_001905 [Trapa natans]
MAGLNPSLSRAFQGLCINEFKDLQFEHQHSFDLQNGEQALERIFLGGRRIRETVIAESRILLLFYLTTYLLLKKNRPKYQTLEPPPPPPLGTHQSGGPSWKILSGRVPRNPLQQIPPF